MLGGDWKRWEENLKGLPADIASERRRVLQLLAAHESHLGIAYVRLMNLVATGCDLEEEAKLPPDERASGFHWGE